MQALLSKIRQILKDRRTRRFFTRVVSSVAAIVIFVTTYALILPAITLEKTAACGIEEHQHSDGCYEKRLVCGQEESDGHHHDDSCYSSATELTCKIPEHLHSAEKGCYDADGNLIGINFDRVWEGTMSDIAYDPEICRNISLDIRYLLFVVDQIGHASYLFDEMVFVD